MPDASPDKEKKKLDKKARLAEELRANLQRRKAQTRSRRIGEADSRPEGLQGKGDDERDQEERQFLEPRLSIS